MRLLQDVEIAVGATHVTPVTREISRHLAPLGARVVWTGDPAETGLFAPAAEAWAEPVRSVSLIAESAAREGQAESFRRVVRLHGLVYDATGLRTRRDLDEFFGFFSTWVPRLDAGAHVVVLAAPPEAVSDAVDGEQKGMLAALRRGVEGFVRSLGKELGRKGSTANLLWASPGAEGRLAGPLRFFLSPHSAFVTCQPLHVDSRVASQPFEYEGPLLGKVAVVTGAARGIGKATARSLYEEGAKLALIEHPAAAAEAAITARDLGAKLLLCDLAQSDAPSKISEWIAAEFGAVDVLVHNAGLTRDKTLSRMSKDAWDLVIDVNLVAALESTRRILEENLLRDNGRIIFVSSVGGIAGNVGQTNYALSKAGLIGYVRAMAPELAGRGITVNAVAPGFIETKMTQAMPAMIREFARRLSALNQGGLPIDVASAVTFFALPENYGVTGAVLRVCGGALIGA